MAEARRYEQLIETVFLAHFTPGCESFEFDREEIIAAAAELGISLPKNVGDIIYTFRYRAALPKAIQEAAPPDKTWVIDPAGKGRYRFTATDVVTTFVPTRGLEETKVPDATPGLITHYALSDEQALLARLRYNRLLDVFTRTACYSLQNHLRTFVPDVGQVETDEVYVGVDRHGVQYVFPVQAKGGRDKLSAVQIRQDAALCAHRFAGAVCRPIGAQFMADDLIALMEFNVVDDRAMLRLEKHYRLVPPDAISPADLARYRRQGDDG